MKWTRINRADGRVELCCKHGVGHPVKQLTRRWDAGWMGVHGCDGCCSTPSFAEEVERRIEQAMAVMAVPEHWTDITMTDSERAVTA